MIIKNAEIINWWDQLNPECKRILFKQAEDPAQPGFFSGLWNDITGWWNTLAPEDREQIKRLAMAGLAGGTLGTVFTGSPWKGLGMGLGTAGLMYALPKLIDWGQKQFKPETKPPESPPAGSIPPPVEQKKTEGPTTAPKIPGRGITTS